MTAPTKRLFVRDATGLVRSFSSFDAFLISAAVILPSLWSYSSQIAFVAAADPGADWVMSEHFGLLFTLPLAIVYVLLAMSMPRSGGDYVWISRVIHPTIGFMSGWAFWISIVSVAGIEGFIYATVTVPIALVSFGYSFGIPSLISLASVVSTPYVAFFIGLVLIIISAIVAGIGAKVFGRVMAILFVLIMLSAFLSFYILGFSTHADFVNAVTGYGGANITYNGVVDQAKSAGWTFAPISMAATLASTPLAVLLYCGQNFSAAAAGEIRNVKRSMWFAIVGSLVFAWVVNVIGTQLAVNVVGYEFVQASIAVGSNWPLAAPPWMPLFVSMLTHNGVILVLIQIGWLVSFIWNIASWLLCGTRYVFAFSFDNAFPSRFADIDEKFHFPVKAMILNIVVAALFLVLATFTSFLGIFLNGVAIWSIVWLFGSIVAIVLPYKKKDLVSFLPGARWKVPFLTIVGLVSAILMAVNFFFSVTTPALGPSTPQADAVLATIFVVGLVIYWASYSYNKNKGIDLKLVYSEIPPE
jgi:amino acid transporter